MASNQTGIAQVPARIVVTVNRTICPLLAIKFATMAVAYFTTWSMFNERNGSKSDVAPTEDGTYIRELGGAEKFLSRKIPGTDKV